MEIPKKEGRKVQKDFWDFCSSICRSRHLNFERCSTEEGKVLFSEDVVLMGTYFHLTHPPTWMAAVENWEFWQQLKHTNYLHNVAHPRMDQILQPINRVITPAYFASSEILDDNFRLGRTWSLTGTDHDLLEVFLTCCANSTICQKYFKKSWSCQTKLALRKIKNLKSWTCVWLLPSPCAQNILSRQFHLLPLRFWREVHRRLRTCLTNLSTPCDRPESHSRWKWH